ncbi:MAG TPA: ABC transporter substrate-binding protein [Desulfitobacterium dehalogenans]|uniref:ABC transporter substrate-binding protein n=1 Tax=Desulfitobacterium dehalogenans TaxID=36854 RepID=A0A7C7DBN4_9FIRM|nr:ABC transporter substrate-binding protein [Desulfitobacterium dehalogenans]
MRKMTVILCSAMVIAFLFFGHLSELSPTQKQPYKVGVIVANDLRLVKVEALKLRLKEMGLIEGENIVFHIENAKNDLSDLPALGKELLMEEPDVLVASGAVEALSLKELTSAQESPTPVVFMGTLSPSVIGLVEDTLRPGNHLTGLNNYHYELTPKRLELLHRLLPEIKKVAILGDTRVPFFQQTQESLHQASQKMGLELSTYTLTSAEGIEDVFHRIQEAEEEGIVLLPGFFLESYTEEIVQYAMAFKIPVFGVYPQDTIDGCLASYGTSNWSQGAQSANMVYKVLQGQNPRVIPVETPDRIIFSVNLKTADKLGITPSQAVLSLADEVVYDE